MKKISIWGTFLAAVAAAVFLTVPAYAKETTIPEGFFVGEASLGGMTEEEARRAVEEEIRRLEDRRIVLDIAGDRASVTAGELGLSWTNEEKVGEEVARMYSGNLVQRYMTRKDVEKNPVHVALETAVDEEKTAEFIQNRAEGLMAEPQNAVIVRTDGAFHITPGVPGKVVDMGATRDALNKALLESSEAEVSVEAAVTEKEPDIVEEDLASIGDVLGTFTTDFSSSGSSRSGNLANGAGKINGHVLMPGETLSGYECMHPFTTENGYYTAAAYEGGRVVDSIGGGVCQIATTLYNAALRAELEITQRQNHSMIVGYVKPSMDAAIAGTVKDIKITNNYSTPIYVEGYTKDRKLTFTIYGKDTRPANRTVEYISETLSSFSAGDPMEQIDPSMAPGSRRQVQSAHRGVKSRLWKVVTVDGVETERTLLHTDTYNASKAIVLVGPPAPVPTVPAPGEQILIPPEQSGETGQAGEVGETSGVNGSTQSETNSPSPSGETHAPSPSSQETWPPSSAPSQGTLPSSSAPSQEALPPSSSAAPQETSSSSSVPQSTPSPAGAPLQETPTPASVPESGEAA